jgi:hypothetical protein
MKKPDFGIIIGSGPSSDDSKDEGSKDGECSTPSGVVAAMEELISAVKDGDAEGAASAFHAAFLACEKEPHDEADADTEE